MDGNTVFSKESIQRNGRSASVGLTLDRSLGKRMKCVITEQMIDGLPPTIDATIDTYLNSLNQYGLSEEEANQHVKNMIGKIYAKVAIHCQKRMKELH